jgi:hypothetical protein
MFLFVALGYAGGVLSLMMQQHPILESSHFWTGTAAILLLGTTSALATFGFASDKSGVLRTFHAYLGSAIMTLLIVHGILGLKLGLALG